MRPTRHDFNLYQFNSRSTASGFGSRRITLSMATVLKAGISSLKERGTRHSYTRRFLTCRQHLTQQVATNKARLRSSTTSATGALVLSGMLKPIDVLGSSE